MKAWTQIKVTSPDDYIIYLSEISVPKPSPIQLSQCGAPAEYNETENEEYEEEFDSPKTKKEQNIKRERMDPDYEVQLFFSKIYPAKECSIPLISSKDEPLLKKIKFTGDIENIDKHILYESNEEQRAALFIQDMYRMYLKLWKEKKATKKRIQFYQAICKPNIQTLIKIQKFIKRFLLRKKYKKVDNYQMQLKKDNMAFLCGRGKKLIDNNYYMFKVYTVSKIKNKDKSIILLFYAKELRTSNVKIYSYNLPKFSSNEDSLIKISNFMIEYCLDLNDSKELYMDKEMYEANRDVLTEMQSIALFEPKVQVKCHLVPKISKQIACALKIQRLFKRFLEKKGKPTNGLIKETIYNTLLKTSEGFFMIKLIAMRNSKTELKKAACFIYVEFKNKYGVIEDDQYKETFPLENMRDYDLSKENFDTLFMKHSKIEFLEDDRVIIDWEDFYYEMEGLEDKEERIVFKSSS